MQYCISATHAAHSRQLWLARIEDLHSNTDNQQINIVRSVVETAEIQALYKQPIYWEQEIGTMRAFSQMATQLTAIIQTEIDSVESGSQFSVVRTWVWILRESYLHHKNYLFISLRIVRSLRHWEGAEVGYIVRSCKHSHKRLTCIICSKFSNFFQDDGGVKRIWLATGKDIMVGYQIKACNELETFCLFHLEATLVSVSPLVQRLLGRGKN
jgi:hypothetical protein